jgi:hypothetical protein
MTDDTTKKVETYVRNNKKITIAVVVLLIGAILLAGFFYGNIQNSKKVDEARNASGMFSSGMSYGIRENGLDRPIPYVPYTVYLEKGTITFNQKDYTIRYYNGTVVTCAHNDKKNTDDYVVKYSWLRTMKFSTSGGRLV